MKCISSPALDNVEIMSYVEGEASDAVIVHIQECPYCRERVQQYTGVQDRLRRELYRVTCPSPQELGEYHLGLLPAPRALVVAQHVRECPLCKRELAELAEFLADESRQPGLPGRMKVLIARWMNPEGLSAPASGFAGLRGEAGEPFIYQADHVRIVIEVQDDAERIGLKTLLGFVSGLESNDFAIQVRQQDRTVAASSVDAIGNFVIDHLPPGHYQLILSSPNIEIRVQSLPVK